MYLIKFFVCFDFIFFLIGFVYVNKKLGNILVVIRIFYFLVYIVGM